MQSWFYTTSEKSVSGWFNLCLYVQKICKMNFLSKTDRAGKTVHFHKKVQHSYLQSGPYG